MVWNRRALQLVFGLAVVAAFDRRALAVEAVLVDRTSQATVTMADYPDDKTGNTVVVAWDNAPGDVPSGAMIFRRERHDSRTAYMAIGGGPVLIVDHGNQTLVSGTVVPVFEVSFAKDWDHQVEMVASQNAKVDVAKLLERYRAFERVAAKSEGKREIDTAIRAELAHTNTACNGSLTADVAWADFEHASQIALAKQAVAVLEAMASSCTDRDFKLAIGKLKRLQVHYLADGALDLASKGSDVVVSMSPKSFNPRETMKHWIKDNL